MRTDTHDHARRPVWRILLAVLALVLAACGGGEEASDPGAEDTTSATEDDGDTGDDSDTGDDGETAAEDGDASGEPIRIGILGECEGAFGAFHEDVVGGASLPFIIEAGATPNSMTSAVEGFTGASLAGRDLELVGIGCGDDTPDRIIQEVRRLVEQQDAEIIFGPLSGDESIAIAQYALDNPQITVISGAAGAQETTLKVQAPNYFRFHGDGAQWNAGLGDQVATEAGWETAAIIVDDYSFGWTSAAGFIADFCAAGGEITSRVYPPLGTTDYSSFIQQLPDPDEVDGYFWVVGGTGTQAALEAFVNAKGDLTGDQHAGNLFFNPSLAQALGPDIAGSFVGGFATPPSDVTNEEIETYLDNADQAWETLPGGTSGGEPAPPSQAASFGFFYAYYTGASSFLQALDAIGGDMGEGHEALREELSTMTSELPYGDVQLDENNQAIIDNYISQLQLDGDQVVQSTVALIPDVTQSFGGTFTEDTPDVSREFPACEDVPDDLPWIGNAIPVVDGVPQE